MWVDGKFVAEARDLDGYPSYLWLPEGAHHVVVYKGGYVRFEEDIEVQRGYRKDLKVRLEKGDSEPPGTEAGKGPGKERASEVGSRSDLLITQTGARVPVHAGAGYPPGPQDRDRPLYKVRAPGRSRQEVSPGDGLEATQGLLKRNHLVPPA